MSTPEPTPAPQAPRRQYVNFVFYKVDPAWRRLPESERAKGKQEFLRAVETDGEWKLTLPAEFLENPLCTCPALRPRADFGTRP